MNRLFLVIITLFLGACATVKPQVEILAFDREGTYRLDGKCTSMRWHSRDQTAMCKGQVGIFVKGFGGFSGADFVFYRIDGVWIFKAEENPTYKNGNSTVTYAISTLLDSASNRAFDLSGECVIEVGSQPKLSCFVSLNNETKVNEIIFSGARPWVLPKE